MGISMSLKLTKSLPDLFVSPAADAPFWRHAAASGVGPVSVGRYGDASWDLRETVVDGVYLAACTIDWNRFPAHALPVAKMLAARMISDGVPPEFVSRHGMATVTHLRPNSNYNTVYSWRTLFLWLQHRGITDLTAVDEETWQAYADEMVIIPRIGRGAAKSLLLGASRLWALANDAGMSFLRPPWYGTEDLADYLPKALRDHENLTPVIPSAVISPLLRTAMRFIDDLSGDIERAKAEWDRLRRVSARTGFASEARSSSPPQAGRDWLAARMRDGLVIPCGPNGEIATAFIAGTIGVRANVMQFLATDAVREYARNNPGPCVIDTEVTGRIDGVPWTPHIDYYEVDELWELLGAAALIVVGYLTGMRLSEVMSLDVGCCEPAVDADYWVIRGRASKKTSSVLLSVDGESEWIAIEPVARTIALLERMVGSGMLFNTSKLAATPKRSKGVDAPLRSSSVSLRIAKFATYVSNSDPAAGEMTLGDGREITFGMFRRTLAYYIARQPGGLIALAVQYNHMRWATSEGYSSRRRDGFADLLDMETARASADALTAVAETIDAGGVVSGPAARRIIKAASAFGETFSGHVMTTGEAKRFMAQAEHQVYPNPDLFLLCHFDRSKAACLAPAARLTADSPKLHNCQSKCGNIARTGSQVLDLSEKARSLERVAADAATVPFLAARIAARAVELRGIERRHYNLQGKA